MLKMGLSHFTVLCTIFVSTILLKIAFNCHVTIYVLGFVSYQFFLFEKKIADRKQFYFAAIDQSDKLQLMAMIDYFNLKYVLYNSPIGNNRKKSTLPFLKFLIFLTMIYIFDSIIV